MNIMEAMATGLPLIVSNCRGNRDLVIDGENGFIFEIDDIDRIKDALIKLYNDKGLRNRFGENSLLMINQYSLDNIMQRMDEIYLSILEK